MDQDCVPSQGYDVGNVTGESESSQGQASSMLLPVVETSGSPSSMLWAMRDR